MELLALALHGIKREEFIHGLTKKKSLTSQCPGVFDMKNSLCEGL
jgi:hypothetical protein